MFSKLACDFGLRVAFGSVCIELDTFRKIILYLTSKAYLKYRNKHGSLAGILILLVMLIQHYFVIVKSYESSPVGYSCRKAVMKFACLNFGIAKLSIAVTSDSPCFDILHFRAYKLVGLFPNIGAPLTYKRMSLYVNNVLHSKATRYVYRSVCHSREPRHLPHSIKYQEENRMCESDVFSPRSWYRFTTVSFVYKE